MVKVRKLHQSTPVDVGGLKEWLTLNTHPAFRHARLNKSAVAPLAVLIGTEEPLTRFEIAKRLGKKSRTLRKPLEKLLEYGIVHETLGRYEVVAGWPGALELAAKKSGALLAEQHDKDTYEVQRAVYRVGVEARNHG